MKSVKCCSSKPGDASEFWKASNNNIGTVKLLWLALTLDCHSLNLTSTHVKSFKAHLSAGTVFIWSSHRSSGLSLGIDMMKSTFYRLKIMETVHTKWTKAVGCLTITPTGTVMISYRWIQSLLEFCSINQGFYSSWKVCTRFSNTSVLSQFSVFIKSKTDIGF